MSGNPEIGTKEDFSRFVAEVEGRADYRRPAAFGLGLAHVSEQGGTAKVLDTRYLTVNFGENHGTWAALCATLGAETTTHLIEEPSLLERLRAPFRPFEGESGHANLDALATFAEAAWLRAPSFVPGRRLVPVVAVVRDLAEAPASVPEVFLRLHLLSLRRVVPHGVALDGLFGLLHNVAWTTLGPVEAEQVGPLAAQVAVSGQHLGVHGVDKFPRLADYVVPSGVRIADANRVRLGAHLAEGTTVMHEGFCNFNAGTLGASMVEGRISAGVTVGAHSDIGGGASIMGTLSGGGTEVVSIGEHCLLGANSGIGISLGDHCTVEAGLYVTGGTPVTLLAEGSERQLKGRELSGSSGLLFYRNGRSGRVEAKGHNASWQGLNAALHQND